MNVFSPYVHCPGLCIYAVVLSFCLLCYLCVASTYRPAPLTSPGPSYVCTGSRIPGRFCPVIASYDSDLHRTAFSLPKRLSFMASDELQKRYNSRMGPFLVFTAEPTIRPIRTESTSWCSLQSTI
ncbi:hypothetical protein M011DRAFT_351734 [Sporormia fimetaria CBS 119925]|uniref:Uncharacterized protein n=1 Tax=Sporormia fimetaria CBS 119925 TaxID=1340428 RepID=A0A6A6VFE7_9PLEO|nr:hypothetical protein M011DRAFT_351734 [Sporormia fimetaria CBS 119925]